MAGVDREKAWEDFAAKALTDTAWLRNYFDTCIGPGTLTDRDIKKELKLEPVTKIYNGKRREAPRRKYLAWEPDRSLSFVAKHWSDCELSVSDTGILSSRGEFMLGIDVGGDPAAETKPTVDGGSIPQPPVAETIDVVSEAFVHTPSPAVASDGLSVLVDDSSISVQRSHVGDAVEDLSTHLSLMAIDKCCHPSVLDGRPIPQGIQVDPTTRATQEPQACVLPDVGLGAGGGECEDHEDKCLTEDCDRSFVAPIADGIPPDGELGSDRPSHSGDLDDHLLSVRSCCFILEDGTCVLSIDEYEDSEVELPDRGKRRVLRHVEDRFPP